MQYFDFSYFHDSARLWDKRRVLLREYGHFGKAFLPSAGLCRLLIASQADAQELQQSGDDANRSAGPNPQEQ